MVNFFFYFLPVGEVSIFSLIACILLCSLPLNADSSLFSVLLKLFWPKLVASRPALLRLALVIDALSMQVLAAFCAYFFAITSEFFYK